MLENFERPRDDYIGSTADDFSKFAESAESAMTEFKPTVADNWDWTKHIPKLSRREVVDLNRLTHFSECSFPKLSLIQPLAELLGISVNQIKIGALAPQIIDSFSVQKFSKQTKSAIFFFSDNSFLMVPNSLVSRIIELVLGGNDKTAKGTEQLTSIEESIAEFLAMHLIEATNAQIEPNFLRFSGSRANLEFLGNSTDFFLKYPFEITINNYTEIVYCFLAATFLESLQAPLQTYNNNFNFLKKTRKFALSLLVGKTEIAVEDLPYLGKNDVILFEESHASLDLSTFSPGMTAFLGDAGNILLLGKIISNPETNKFLFEIEQINVHDLSEVIERKNMSKETMNEEILENLAVNLRVQFAAQKLTLKEIGGLREGQIIQLGCRPNDLVEVVFDTDGKKIATGRLVEIEGNLGVKLVKIYK